MKTKYSISLLAIAAVLGAPSFAMADTAANSFGASVSVLSPDQTGFIIGGQVAVTGVGTGGLTLSRSVASMALTGEASSGLTYADDTDYGTLIGGTSTAKINSELDFDRSIQTSGAMVGLGSVLARGEAIAALGSAGAASADTSTSGTGATDEDAAGTSTASASAQGSLNGSQSTSNSLQLLGASGLFAGSNGMTIGEYTTADAYGSSEVTGDGSTGINLTTARLDQAAYEVPLLDGNGDPVTEVIDVDGTPTTVPVLVNVIRSGTGTGFGALFNVETNLSEDLNNEIVMNVANAGNGSISLTSSTGGFFTGGAAASADGSRNQTGSFFSNP